MIWIQTLDVRCIIRSNPAGTILSNSYYNGEQTPMHEQESCRKPCCMWQHTILQPISQHSKSCWLLTRMSMLKASYLAALYKARHGQGICEELRCSGTKVLILTNLAGSLVLLWALRGKDLTIRRKMEEDGLMSKTVEILFRWRWRNFYRARTILLSVMF